MSLYTVHYQKSENVFAFQRFINEDEAASFAVWAAVEKNYFNIHTEVKEV